MSWERLRTTEVENHWSIIHQLKESSTSLYDNSSMANLTKHFYRSEKLVEGLPVAVLCAFRQDFSEWSNQQMQFLNRLRPAHVRIKFGTIKMTTAGAFDLRIFCWRKNIFTANALTLFEIPEIFQYESNRRSESNSNNMSSNMARLPLIRSLADIGRNHSSTRSKWEGLAASKVILLAP